MSEQEIPRRLALLYRQGAHRVYRNAGLARRVRSVKGNVSMPNACRIMVLTDPSIGISRELVIGFGGPAQVREWTLYRPKDNYDRAIQSWQPHGIALGCGISAECINQWDGPLISMQADYSLRGIPSICADDYSTGQLAAKHLMKTGAQHFSYFGDIDAAWSRLRMEGFRDELARHDRTASVWAQHPAAGQPEPWADESLARWLASLPRPTAIFAGCDGWALVLASACRSFNISVPDDVAILGVDNDELECALSMPPLSSIEMPWRRIGEQATHLMDRALRGVCPKNERVLLPPVGVVPRGSTESVAVKDPQVALALRIIRAHKSKPLAVKDLAAQVSVSQPVLERNFRQHVGRPVLAEIRRVHVEQAKRLLCTTDLPIEVIANHSGFPDTIKLGQAFRRETGLTPAFFRKQYRR